MQDEPPKKLSQNEWRDQRGYNAFLSKILPADAYYTAIDVGRSASANQGMMRKMRGVKPGIPDFVIAWNGIALWLECKTAGGSLSPHQKTTRDALLHNGHRWALVRSMEDIEAACIAAGIPLRATVGVIRDRIAAQPTKPKHKAAARPQRGSDAWSAVAQRAAKRGIFV